MGLSKSKASFELLRERTREIGTIEGVVEVLKVDGLI